MPWKKRKSRSQREAEEEYPWCALAEETFNALRDEFAQLTPSIVDCKLIGDLGGSADDMGIWYICERRADLRALKAGMNAIHARYLETLKDAGFPEASLASFGCTATSLEDIEDGGGSFYFFR